MGEKERKRNDDDGLNDHKKDPLIKSEIMNR